MSDDFAMYPEFIEVATQTTCQQWMGTAPCGALAAWHVIWDTEIYHSFACTEHVGALRQYAYLSLHEVENPCLKSPVVFDEAEDRCVDEIDGWVPIATVVEVLGRHD